MKKIYLYFLLLIAVVLGACRNDESYKQDQPESSGSGEINFALAGRVGTVVGEPLTEYIHSLNLFLFRENKEGEYILFRQKLLDKQQLNILSQANMMDEAGFTEFKEIVFDSVPIANYRIVGLANAKDSIGETLNFMSISGAVIGNTMEDVLATVSDGEESPYLFFGMTGTIRVGAESGDLPVLRLYRKVSMFALTLLEIPDVIGRIDMEFGNTYGSFNMKGSYIPESDIIVLASDDYTQQIQDSIQLDYVMLPTVEGDSTFIRATFYLLNGSKQVVNLPKYVFRPNTITKVTATIDPDQAGGNWKMNLNSLITVNVEWNVDQQPPIKI
ncbi:MAG: FimB/Mfa2 family fimbrial subunit [Odoribacter sp.]